MDQKKEIRTWDEIRKTGLFVFILSLPVMIWKSSKFGRTLAWITISMFVFWFAGRLSDVIFAKFINRWEVRSESNKVLNSISAIKKNIDSVSSRVDLIDDFIKRRNDEIFSKVVSDYRDKFKELDSKIGGIEQSIDAFSLDQRASVKERIVALRESVLVNKENINSKKTRMEFEDLVKNIKLLTLDEKKRFKKDLKDMGFYVNEVESGVSIYRSGSIYASSFDTVSVRPYMSSISQDSTIVRVINEDE